MLICPAGGCRATVTCMQEDLVGTLCNHPQGDHHACASEAVKCCESVQVRTEIWPSSVPCACLMTMERILVGMRSS